jgi:hypothetical protein
MACTRCERETTNGAPECAVCAALSPVPMPGTTLRPDAGLLTGVAASAGAAAASAGMAASGTAMTVPSSGTAVPGPASGTPVRGNRADGSMADSSLATASAAARGPAAGPMMAGTLPGRHLAAEDTVADYQAVTDNRTVDRAVAGTGLREGNSGLPADEGAAGIQGISRTGAASAAGLASYPGLGSRRTAASGVESATGTGTATSPAATADIRPAAGPEAPAGTDMPAGPAMPAGTLATADLAMVPPSAVRASLPAPAPAPASTAGGRRIMLATAALVLLVACCGGVAVLVSASGPGTSAHGQLLTHPGGHAAGSAGAAGGQPGASHRTRAHGAATPSAPPAVTIAPAARQQPHATAVGAFLAKYFRAINHRDYQAYLRLFSPASRPALSAASFVTGYGTTHDSAPKLTGLAPAGLRELAATVAFTSHQDATTSPEHATCLRWRITVYLISHGVGHERYYVGNPPAGYSANSRAC